MNTRSRILLLITLVGAIGLFVYRDVLYQFVVIVLNREDGSHGIFTPFISGYIIWRRQEKLRNQVPHGSLLAGLSIIALGFLVFTFRPEGLDPAIGTVSFLVVLTGLIVLLFGRHVLRELSFPLFFLIAAFPFPQDLYVQLTEWMRIATTWGSVGLLKLFGFPIFRNGYNVSIPGLDLFVAEACSGIRYLIPYFVFGLAYAFLSRTNLRARSLVVLATIPISILAGIMRQSCVFLSAYYIGPFMADHKPHVVISWAVFVSILITAMWIDQRILGVRISRHPVDTLSSVTSP